MSRPRVDPPLFRRRTFEREWHAPLVAAACGGDPLSSILLAEADAWLSFGAKLGYFSITELLSPSDRSESRLAQTIIASIERLSLPAGLSAPAFAQALSDAREDLTDNRRELLRRILFSSPAEWDEAIEALDDLPSALELGREEALAALENWGWALENTLEVSAAQRELQAVLPAAWRSGSLEGLAAEIPGISGRVSELARVHEQVRETLDIERAPAASAGLVIGSDLALVNRVPAEVSAPLEIASPALSLLTRGETSPEQLAQFGMASARVYTERHEWIHSTVEEISFPDEDAPIVRRRMRLDFTIPMGLVPLEFPGGATTPLFYVPVSEIPKWPGMLDLELRTGSGEALPLLTRRQSAIIDGALLVAIAEGSTGISLSQKMDAQVREVAHAGRDGPRGAQEALHRLYEHDPGDPGISERLEDDELFAATATELASHSIVWARVCGWPGEQRVLEIKYETSTDLKLRWTSSQAFGLRPLGAFIDVGPFSSADHRVEINAPASMRLVRVTVGMGSEELGDNQRAGATVQTAVTRRRKRASVRFATTSADALPPARMWLALTVDQAQATGLALAGSVLCASTLLAAYVGAARFTLNTTQNTTQSAGLAALLLIGAALAGSGAITSLQRGALASALLAGTRRVALIVSTLGLVGALSLLLRAGSSPGQIESVVLGDIFVFASLLFAAALALSWRRSRTNRTSRFLPYERIDVPLGPVWDVVSGELERRPVSISR